MKEKTIEREKYGEAECFVPPPHQLHNSKGETMKRLLEKKKNNSNKK